MEKNFVILMSFVLLAFGALFSTLSIQSGESLSGMFSMISGEYAKRSSQGFLTTAEQGSRLAPPSASKSCPMSTKEGKLIVNAPPDTSIRLLYSETGAEIECRTGSFTKNMCRANLKIIASKQGFETFEKVALLGAGEALTVNVELKPGASQFVPCSGAVEPQRAVVEQPPITEAPTPVAEPTVQQQETSTEPPVEVIQPPPQLVCPPDMIEVGGNMCACPAGKRTVNNVCKLCEEAIPPGFSIQKPNYDPKIMEALNKEKCVSGASITLPAEIKIGTCTYFELGDPIITIDRTVPLCQSPCGQVPCGQSKTCSCGARCTLTVTCGWGGWKNLGNYTYSPLFESKPVQETPVELIN